MLLYMKEVSMYKGSKNNIVLIVLILAGIVIGGFLSEILGNVPGASWLGYGSAFGITSPFMLDLGVLTMQFAFSVKFTIGGILGIIIAIFIYRKM